jgi:hypothetical protein
MLAKTCTLLLIVFCLFSCNDSVSPTNQICAQIKGNDLIITNKSDATVYYAAFERNSLANLDWGPFCNDENRVSQSRSKVQKLSDIYAYQANDTIVLYWWECDGATVKTADLKNMVIPTDAARTVCAKAR